MAYTPVNWQTGDTITAERLNRMDRGWDVETTELFSETVTTAVDPEHPDDPAVAQLAYSGIINADSITVTFDGTEYTCPRINVDAAYAYGGFNDSPDFTEYPFFIWSGSGTNMLVTETAGEHTVAAAVSSIQTSADFSVAVSSIVDAAINAVSQSLPLRCVSGQTEYSAMTDAQTDGRLMYFQHERKTYFAHSVGQTGSGNKKVKFFPENSGITVGFENNVFTVSTATESS